VLWLLMSALAGCGGGGDAWPPEPATVELGADACAGCRMIISDGRWAAQYRAAPGAEVERFDDLGCLLERHGGAACDPVGVFVASFADEGWVRGDTGWVAMRPDLASPMGHGLAVFATRDEAAAAAATILPLSTLLRNGVPAAAASGAPS
jgi:hypothetical protein